MILNRTSPDTEIDLSLRLWSDTIPLDPIVKRLSLPLQHLHVAGQPIPRHRGASDRIAPTHYASVAQLTVHTQAEVLNWFRRTLEALRNDTEVSSLLSSGEIDATLWIAILGRGHAPSPRLPTDVLRSAAALNLSILSENYTVPDDPPEKVWLSRSRTARQVAT